MHFHQWLPKDMVRMMDFAGGTVIHVNIFSLATTFVLLIVAFSFGFWAGKRKR